jgi:hypothetical protein
MRTRNTQAHPLLVDAILAREEAWVIEEECTDGSHRPCCLIQFEGGQTDHGCPHGTFPEMATSRLLRRRRESADNEIAEMMNTPVAMDGAVRTPDSRCAQVCFAPATINTSHVKYVLADGVGQTNRHICRKPSGKTKTQRPQVSHFETLTHLMLRRSESARGGVMGLGANASMDEEENQ